MNPLQNQEKLYELILQATISATRAMGGILTLNDKEGHPQVIVATWSKDAGDENRLTGLIQEEINQTNALDFISLSKQPQFSIDRTNPTLPLFKARMESHPEVDLIIIPLLLRKGLTGFISIHRENCLGEISASEMQATSILLSHAASAIENRRLFLQLEEAYLSSVKSLAKTLELKDEYTHGHSERVAEICLRIGRRMSMEEASLKVLYNAALLHDIGKIGVLEVILNKNSKLDNEEFRLIKRHPELGEQILLAIPSLQEERRIVRHHHEREDGRGYPDGLYGNKLLLPEKIIILADAFDAMNSKRPYRLPLPPEVIKAEIEKMKGMQFDQEVTDVFLEMFHDFIDMPSQSNCTFQKIVSIEDFKGLAISSGKKK
jgi:HD-GYP domain-containing protein (c-di-GMP phosphodiesterase class II)